MDMGSLLSVSKGLKKNGSAMHSIKASQQLPISDFMLQIIDDSNQVQQCKILIKAGHKVSWKRSSRHGKVIYWCAGVGENFPDGQDRDLGTKCAMESQFPT